eukprot:7442658-Ditylum_brightwellii.AAC.1
MLQPIQYSPTYPSLYKVKAVEMTSHPLSALLLPFVPIYNHHKLMLNHVVTGAVVVADRTAVADIL